MLYFLARTSWGTKSVVEGHDFLFKGLESRRTVVRPVAPKGLALVNEVFQTYYTWRKRRNEFLGLFYNRNFFLIFFTTAMECYFVQLNVSLLHCFCVLFNSFAKLYTHFWPFTSTSGGKIILQTLVVVITATSVCKMIFSILQPLVAVITATSVCNYSH